MTTLPNAVQRQLEEAEELERNFNAKPDEPTTDPAPPTEDPAPEPPPVPEPKSTPDEDRWEARYKSLKGMYDSQVPSLQAEVRTLQGQLADAIRRMDEAAKAPKPKDTRTPKVTEKDVEAFGGDLVDLIKRQAEEIAAEAIGELHAKVQLLEETNAKLTSEVGGVAENQGELARNTFLSRLTELVPDWEATNVNPDFLAWLAEVDPVSNVQRQKWLEDAYTKLDAGRTAKLFTMWKPTTPEAPKPAREPLERQVTPSSTKSPTPISASEDRVWTAEDIQQFFNDITRGVYKGRDADAKQIEAQIDRAISEGRVKA